MRRPPSSATTLPGCRARSACGRSIAAASWSGVAFTVRTRPGDNLAIHQALELVGPGDVIVVDGGGDETRALVGEIMKNDRRSIAAPPAM